MSEIVVFKEKRTVSKLNMFSEGFSMLVEENNTSFSIGDSSCTNPSGFALILEIQF